MPELPSKASSSDNKADNWPFVSVLMPVRNEAQYITRSLEAVLAQEYPGSVEVLVVDGMSDDGTRDIVTGIAADNPQVHLLDNPGQLVAIALNRGAARARGDIFVRVDGRAFLPPGYVRRCVQLLTETGAANVGGMQVPIADTVQGRAIAAAMASPFGVGTARFRFATRPQEVDTVYLGAWPRAFFKQVGGFDESLVRNQDYEFNYRLRQAGGTILYSPELRVEYYGRPTLSALWRQYFDYGFWKAHVIALHPGSTHPRHLIAPLFVLGLLVGAVLSLLGSVWRVPYVATLLIYALLTLTISVVQAARHGWRNLPLLPLVFLTLHLSWGIGFWTGVGRGWLFRQRKEP